MLLTYSSPHHQPFIESKADMECSLLYSTAQSEVMWQLSIAIYLIIVEAPIPNHDPIGNLQGTRMSSLLGLNFDQVKINSAMTHVLVLSVKVRKNERSW